MFACGQSTAETIARRYPTVAIPYNTGQLTFKYLSDTDKNLKKKKKLKIVNLIFTDKEVYVCSNCDRRSGMETGIEVKFVWNFIDVFSNDN